MSKPNFGVLGLGVMGSNLALNAADKGFDIAVYNRTDEVQAGFEKSAGALIERIDSYWKLDEFVAGLARPRSIFMMVTAGKVVDIVLDDLLPLLEEGDLVIDGGNSDYKDTIRRTRMMEEKGLGFLGVGVSGGEVGARFGPSMMIGGSEQLYDQVDEILKTMAAEYEGSPCADWLGPDGAGHFVKTVHNGIEYADMQMIAEAYGVMSNLLGMRPREIGEVFARWNEGELSSYLVEITADLMSRDDPETGKPMVDVIMDKAGQKGTGRWTVIESQTMGIPATAMEAAVTARALSARKNLREEAQELYGAPKRTGETVSREAVLEQLRHALVAGKIIAYTQGFNVLTAASAEHEWNLDLARIAEIWRAGCIIRSKFLDDIADAFRTEKELRNLLFAPSLVDRVNESLDGLRATVLLGVREGEPMLGFAAVLTYFDYFRSARSTANVIQAQRDYFGAHGFQRTDRDGTDHHGPWALGTLGDSRKTREAAAQADALQTGE